MAGRARGSQTLARRSVRGSEAVARKSEEPERRAASTELRPADLDRLIHERIRLAIVSALAVNERLTFNELKLLLKTTDGNLSVHAQKLEDADYIASDKSFAG